MVGILEAGSVPAFGKGVGDGVQFEAIEEEGDGSKPTMTISVL